ncbi:MAG: xylulokinase [Clostridia bacterium]|nr:xylulokinase [Clostridia bacterium]
MTTTKKKYVIGIDVGTSGTKSVLFDTNGEIVAGATAEYPLLTPQNGWAEQEPEWWWEATVKTLGEITKAACDGEIAGLGLSGQMHSLVLLDDACRVIRPAILWCDQRTAHECAEIEALIGRERLIEITANPALTGFTASKIMWVKNHEPQNFKRIKHVLLAKDYIRYRLTGVFATEVSDASGMQLLDVKNRCWSEEVCRALGIDTAWLATCCESPDHTGSVSPEAAAQTGLPVGLAVAGGAGDNAAAAIGTGVYCEGRAFATVGTSGVVFAPTSAPVIDKKGRIHTFCAAVPDTWHVMGVTQAAGLSLNWFRAQMAPTLSYPTLDKMASEVAIGADKLLYLPYLMGERTPILDADARGVFFGLSAAHTTAHLARAVMEGVSYSLYSCLALLGEVGITPTDMALCGGGAKSTFWCQMLTDVFGIPTKTLTSTESAALGAAILGGVAGGVFDSVKAACDKLIGEKARQVPNADNHTAYMALYRLYEALYPAVKENFATLAAIDLKG